MVSTINYISMLALATILTSSAVLPFYGIAHADPPWGRGNPNDPTAAPGIVMTEDTADTCDADQTASSTKGGVSVQFIVPDGITDVENSGEGNKGVNIHVAFESNLNNYFEAGIIYGDSWTEGPGLPSYDQEEFHFYWGRGSQISGVSTTLPVVAGHEVRVDLIYIDGQGAWKAFFHDLTTDDLESHTIVSNSEQVASDYILSIETQGAGPNDNSERLGLVEVTDLDRATIDPGNGVIFSNWPDAYLTDCFSTGLNGQYGVEQPTGVGEFEMGYQASITTDGYQLW